jgi:hypothetical protein
MGIQGVQADSEGYLREAVGEGADGGKFPRLDAGVNEMGDSGSLPAIAQRLDVGLEYLKIEVDVGIN